MTNMFGTTYTGGVAYRSASEVNSAMGRVYGHMSLAVIVSMIVSYFVGSSPELLAFFFTGWMKWIVIFSPLAAIFGVGYVLSNNPTKGVAQLCQCLYGSGRIVWRYEWIWILY